MGKLAQFWLIVFAAGYPLNLALGRHGLRHQMSYGDFLINLTVVNAVVATGLTAALAVLAGVVG